jgi:hypothetical protein
MSSGALREKLSPFLDSCGEPTGAETNRDVFNLVLTTRELVLGLDGLDPEFCVVSLPPCRKSQGDAGSVRDCQVNKSAIRAPALSELPRGRTK